MSYTPINWQTGDVITATKLNHMEDGISGGGLIVNADIETTALNKTWQEIYDTIASGNMAVIVTEDEEDGQIFIQEADVIVFAQIDTGVIPNEYKIRTGNSNTYETNSANGYPIMT